MKIITIVFSLLAMQASFSQECATVAANKSERITRFEDQFMNLGPRKPASWDITKMKPHQDKVESWIRNLLTGFTGAKVGYTHEYSLDHVNGGSYINDFYKTTGIKGYCFSTTRFWAYYCYGNSNTIHTQGEAGSFIYVTFNNVFPSALTSDVGVFTVNGKFVFRVLEKSHTEGRVDFYDLRKRMDFSDTVYTSKRDIIIIRNSDKPVFIPITRKEYLQQMLKDAEASRKKQKEMMTSTYNNSTKSFEEEMKSFKLDKNYTPEKEAKRRKWFGEDQAKLEKLIKKIDSDVDASIEVITQYLQKPSEWLNRHVGSFFSYSHYTAKGLVNYFEGLDTFTESKEDYTRLEIVSINPDYFNKSLSNDVPQLIMVELVKNSYRYMYKISDKVKQPGGLTSLVAMVKPASGRY
jgi:hypothetical protein